MSYHLAFMLSLDSISLSNMEMVVAQLFIFNENTYASSIKLSIQSTPTTLPRNYYYYTLNGRKIFSLLLRTELSLYLDKIAFPPNSRVQRNNTNRLLFSSSGP